MLLIRDLLLYYKSHLFSKFLLAVVLYSDFIQADKKAIGIQPCLLIEKVKAGCAI
jgi:hypothetical protein